MHTISILVRMAYAAERKGAAIGLAHAWSAHPTTEHVPNHCVFTGDPQKFSAIFQPRPVPRCAVFDLSTFDTTQVLWFRDSYKDTCGWSVEYHRTKEKGWGRVRTSAVTRDTRSSDGKTVYVYTKIDEYFLCKRWCNAAHGQSARKCRAWYCESLEELIAFVWPLKQQRRLLRAC